MLALLVVSWIVTSFGRNGEGGQPVDGGSDKADFPQVIEIDVDGHDEIPSVQATICVWFPACRPPDVAWSADFRMVLVGDLHAAPPDDGDLKDIMNVSMRELFGAVMVIPQDFERMSGRELRMSAGYYVEYVALRDGHHRAVRVINVHNRKKSQCFEQIEQ